MELDRRLGIVLAAAAVAGVSFGALPAKLAVVSCLLGWAMLAIAVVDARSFIIPDVLSLPAIPAGLLASGWLLDPSSAGLASLDHVIGMAAGGVGLWLVREAYFRVRGREGLGLGDVKLAAAAGAWVGWQSLANVILLAAAIALGVIVAVSYWRGRQLSGAARIPFGCFLAPSIWLAWLLEIWGRTL